MSTPNSTTIEKLSDLEREFQRLQRNGFIGDPSGKLAYAYIRVSSDGQADEGRSGLPRQIKNIHIAAQREGYKITFDLVFADDYTGFEFEGRPELSRLRKEYRTPSRRADVVIMEDIDRLSRDSDFHQGFLLDDMKRYGIQPIFYEDLEDDFIRSVKGAASTAEIKKAKKRMHEGTLNKARRGEPTSKRRPYGYEFEDSYYIDKNGNSHIRRKTSLTIYEKEAIIVREIYTLIAGGSTMSAVAKKFTDENVPLPGKSTYWAVSFISELIKNPIYRGEYLHGRRKTVQTQVVSKDGLTLEPKKKRIFADESETIPVKVPAIVSRELWQAANEQIQRNKNTSKRNAKREYLLSGLLKCSCCGYGYHGKVSQGNYAVYRCSSNTYGAAQRPNGLTCDQPSISTTKLDNAVWETIWGLLFTGDNIIKALEARMNSESNESIASQIAYLEKQLSTARNAIVRAQDAYERGDYDLDTFRERTALHKKTIPTLEAELARLKPRQLTPEQFESQKREIMAIVDTVHASGIQLDLSFEFKKKMINRVVDKIELDTKKGEFTIYGTIGKFTAMGVVFGSIDSAFVHKFGSNRRFFFRLIHSYLHPRNETNLYVGV